MWGNDFNISIIQWLNQYAALSPTFNQAVNHLADNNATKGLPIMLVYWFLFFRESPNQLKTRSILVLTLFGAFVAMALALLVNLAFPFTPRPYVNDALVLTPLVGLVADANHMLFFVSSFPSDTAALFAALATGIFLASKPIGIVTLIYTLLFIIFPRVYLRLHYPTDVLAGAFIGITSVLLCIWLDKRQVLGKFSLNVQNRYPGFFHAFLFFVSFEIVDMFLTLRRLAGSLHRVLLH
jgi:membrane-associated phospholipid phosphatase